MVEINRLPAIVMHRPRAIGSWEGDDAVAQMPLEGDRTAVDPLARVGGEERRRGEAGGGARLRPAGVPELDLAAAVRQLLGDHPMATGPAVVEGVGLAPGVGGAAQRQDQPREVLVAAPSGAALTAAAAGRPRGDARLELTAPATGEVDHLVGELRCRKDGRGEPLEIHRHVGIERCAQGEDVGRGIDGDLGLVGQPVAGVAVAQQQIFRARFNALEAELGQDGCAVRHPQHQPRLARKAADRFRAEREVGVGIEHAAGDVDGMGLLQHRQVLAVRQPGTPVDDLRQAHSPCREDQSLPAIVEPPGPDHYLTAPKVRPAMKWRCIKKNMMTGGMAATIEPAETSCHCATHWPLSE